MGEDFATKYTDENANVIGKHTYMAKNVTPTSDATYIVEMFASKKWNVIAGSKRTRGLTSSWIIRSDTKPPTHRWETSNGTVLVESWDPEAPQPETIEQPRYTTYDKPKEEENPDTKANIDEAVKQAVKEIVIAKEQLYVSNIDAKVNMLEKTIQLIQETSEKTKQEILQHAQQNETWKGKVFTELNSVQANVTAIQTDLTRKDQQQKQQSEATQAQLIGITQEISKGHDKTGEQFARLMELFAPLQAKLGSLEQTMNCQTAQIAGIREHIEGNKENQPSRKDGSPLRKHATAMSTSNG
jgi:hypothetical protein